jgi:O-antigen/teichoic acid export membrane protein
MIRTEAIGSDLDAGDLREKVRSGLGWKLMTFLIGQGTQSAVAILLAHLLLPRDFGLAGMAIAFSGLAAVFSDLGLGMALIQRRTLTEEDRSTVFWINVGGGAALTLLGVALSPVVADFFSNARVMPLFAVLSCSFVLVALGQTQAALLTREMSFRSLELRTIAATLVGAAAAVWLAVAGFGPWAIIAQVLCTSGASTLMLWTVSPWRPRLAFSRSSFKTLGSFGFKTLLIRLLLYVNLNGDNLLIGRYIGSVALGVYAIAYNVMLLPTSRITGPVRDVLYAAFVRLQNEPRRMGEAWLRFNSLTASLLVPAFLGLVVTAPDFVPLVLGRRWDAAIPVLEFLSVAGVAQSLQAFNGQVYQALGLPGLFLRFMVFSTGVTFSAFVIGLHWGVSGVAASFAVARTIVLVANTIQMSRLVELGLWRTLYSYLAVIWRAGAMAASVYAGRMALHHAGLAIAPRLVVISVGGAIFYFALTAVAAPELVRDLRNGLRGRVSAAT